MPFAGQAALKDRWCQSGRFEITVPLPTAFVRFDWQPAFISAAARATKGYACNLAIELPQFNRARLLSSFAADIVNVNCPHHNSPFTAMTATLVRQLSAVPAEAR